MGKVFLGAPLLIWAAGALTSCQSTERVAAAPVPESEQVVRESLKELYMSVSAAPAQSEKKKKLILRMADEASKGKELMLTMRAAMGITASSPQDDIQSAVTTKMMKVGTLDQLTDFEKQYEVPPATARPYVQRMFELGNGQTDPRVWQRIRATASRLKLADLEQAARVKAEELSRQ